MEFNVLANNKLPSIMSDIEFKKYFEKYLNGDQQALEILILHNLKLVYWFIKDNIECNINDYEDIFSVGVEALVESFSRFDITKGNKFSTFATACIRNKILKYFRSERKSKNIISLNDEIDYIKIIDDKISLEDRIIDEDYYNYQKNLVLKILNCMDEVDQKIILLAFGFINNRVFTQSEISKIVCLSQSQVSKRLSKNLKIFKEIINLEMQSDLKKLKLCS